MTMGIVCGLLFSRKKSGEFRASDDHIDDAPRTTSAAISRNRSGFDSAGCVIR